MKQILHCVISYEKGLYNFSLNLLNLIIKWNNYGWWIIIYVILKFYLVHNNSAILYLILLKIGNLKKLWKPLICVKDTVENICCINKHIGCNNNSIYYL